MSEPSRWTNPGALRGGLALLGVLALASWARLVAFGSVVGEQTIRLASDSDPYYHLLQAERLLAGHATWFDPNLNWPHGATVLWPPGFDAVLAAAARVSGGPAPSPRALELAAAVVPVLLGLLTVLTVVALGSFVLGVRRGLVAGLLLAVLPAHVFFSSIGVADQHVAEVLLSSAIMLALAAGTWGPSPARRWAARGALAVVIAGAFWNWQGAALALAVPLAFAGTAFALLGPEDDATVEACRTVAAGAALGAALLGGSVALWGAPGALASTSVKGVTGLHVAIAAGSAAFAGALLLAHRWRRATGTVARRAGVGAATLGVVGALSLALLPDRAGVAHGITALTAANPWYAQIEEFRRLVFSCRYPVGDELGILARTYGLTFVAAVFAVPSLVTRFGRGGRDRGVALLLACWAVPMVALAFLRVRFAPYATVPLVLLAAEGVWWVARAIPLRALGGREAARPWIAAALAVAALAPAVPATLRGVRPMPEPLVEAMLWLRTQPARPGREGVLATWDLGHLVLYFARKPVVASPFGTDAGVDSMVDLARFDLSVGDEQAAAILAERRAGWVVVSDPIPNSSIDQGFVGGVPVVERQCSFARGQSIQVFERYSDTTAARLFYFDGQTADGHDDPSLGTLRLVYEAPGQMLKVFEAVPGASLRITGAAPSAEVTASVYLRTNVGREVAWSTRARANGAGEALLRLPYASGGNGAIFASPWIIRTGARTASLPVDPAAVSEGALLHVDGGS